MTMEQAAYDAWLTQRDDERLRQLGICINDIQRLGNTVDMLKKLLTEALDNGFAQHAPGCIGAFYPDSAGTATWPCVCGYRAWQETVKAMLAIIEQEVESSPVTQLQPTIVTGKVVATRTRPGLIISQEAGRGDRISLREALYKILAPCPHCNGTGKTYNNRAAMPLLRSQRLLKQLTAQAVAEQLGISVQYLCDLEMGEQRLPNGLVDQYVAILEAMP